MNKLKISVLFLLSSLCLFSIYGKSKKSKNDQSAIVASTEAADTSKISYDYLLIERVGGGDKLFSLTTNNDSVVADFARYNFRDTTFSLNLTKSEIGDTLHALIGNILIGEQQIIKKDTAYSAKGFMMGSWIKCYAVKDTIKTQITDEKAKEGLTEIERVLESKINPSND